jgi:Family of unknown function (DUF6444)
MQTLQAQLKQTSRNSARPPSSDPPSHPRPQRPRSKRRRGGQPGHPGQTRTLLPVADVDKVVIIKPEQCTHCDAPLSGDDPQPWRHQVMEIPPVEPLVTEYQWHQLLCVACGEVTRAPWPAGVPSGTYGPRVQAMAALCTGAYRLSKRTTQQMMHEVFAIPLRAYLKRSRSSCETPHHQVDHGDSDPRLSGLGQGLVVFTQPPRAIEPAECAFHDPAPLHHLKALGVPRAFHDHQSPLQH